MSEDAVAHTTARIDRALSRIEAAMRSHGVAHAELKRRHTLLRDNIGSVIATIDAEIAREDPAGGDADG